MALHLYGFISSGAAIPSDLRGVGEQRIDVETHERAAALVSGFSGDAARGTRDDLLAHAHALERLAESTTVLPMQFGVVFDDAEQLRSRVLEPSHDLLVDLLDRFDGTVEMMVKAFYFEEKVYAEIVGDNPKIARLRESTRDVSEAASYYDRIALGELVQQALEQKKATDGSTIVDGLAVHAIEVKPAEPAVHMMAAQASFLVVRENLTPFLEAVEQLQDRLGDAMRIKVVGPLPPYTFAAGSLPAESHA
jgi:hypothetical protein